ncbi:hypothetical protein CDEST_05587 [Colletotrichum destructivum]|uniref:Uncharacterized protein n=1 Tax=Colletotrichum destructivum TaxID=34406 RepID=A0AAX4IC59_9PEZI|nr:hypothetical protein CDEST_05587 [Colletotrichum destructivum]
MESTCQKGGCLTGLGDLTRWDIKSRRLGRRRWGASVLAPHLHRFSSPFFHFEPVSFSSNTTRAVALLYSHSLPQPPSSHPPFPSR